MLMRIITLISSFIIIVLGVTFAFLNAAPVIVNYYVGSSELPLSILLVSVLGVGTFLGVLIGLVPIIKLKFSNGRLRRHLAKIEKEVTQSGVSVKGKS